MKGLTVDQITSDHITLLGQQYWSPDTKQSHLPYDPKIIDDIYKMEIKATSFSLR